MLADAGEVISTTQAREMERAVAELRTLGVDWSTGPNAGPSAAEVVLSTSTPNNLGVGGQDFLLTARVTNRGEHPLYQVRAITESDYSLFDGRELVFGRINPGETREWTITLGQCSTQQPRNQRVCRLPRDVIDRADAIQVEFVEAHGRAPATAEIRTEIRAIEGPQFAYSVQTADDVRGNGDGQLQVGEMGSIYMRVRNVGPGTTFAVQANLRNLSGTGVLLHAGRFELQPIAPGAEQLVRFTFEVLPEFRREEAKLEISVYDTELREAVVENVAVPLTGVARATTAATGRVQINADTPLRAWAAADAPVVGTTRGAVALPRTATLGDFTRVDLGEGRPAWVATVGHGHGQRARADRLPAHTPGAHHRNRHPRRARHPGGHVHAARRGARRPARARHLRVRGRAQGALPGGPLQRHARAGLRAEHPPARRHQLHHRVRPRER
jgi:carboxyl-terminal processing protease